MIFRLDIILVNNMEEKLGECRGGVTCTLPITEYTTFNMPTSFFFFFFSERAARAGGGGVRCQTFSFSFFPCSADHERDWPPCKVVFFGLATNALNVTNNNNNNNH